MQRGITIMILCSLLFIYFLVPINENTMDKNDSKVQSDKKTTEEITNYEKALGEQIKINEKDGIKFVSISELEKTLKFKYQFESLDRIHLIEYKNKKHKIPYNLLTIEGEGNTTNLNGAYIESEDVRLTLEDVQRVFSLNIVNVEDKFYVSELQNKIEFYPCKVTENNNADKLLGAVTPILNSHLPKIKGQLPGATREYRNGEHEGIDWYSKSIGVDVNFTTEIYPIYEGQVVRADHSYSEMTLQERNELLEIAAKSEKTPEYILDKMRGRQVWIQSPNGVLVRYAHLSSVNSELNVGEYVSQKYAIGKAGNSGTSNGVKGTKEDIHLHTDLVMCGKIYYDYFDNLDTAHDVLLRAFNNKKIGD